MCLECREVCGKILCDEKHIIGKLEKEESECSNKAYHSIEIVTKKNVIYKSSFWTKRCKKIRVVVGLLQAQKTFL